MAPPLTRWLEAADVFAKHTVLFERLFGSGKPGERNESLQRRRQGAGVAPEVSHQPGDVGRRQLCQHRG